MKLLEMIESVDPSDNDALDDIDARVLKYLLGDDFVPCLEHYPKYTRSRDALKAIRPEVKIYSMASHRGVTWECGLVIDTNPGHWYSVRHRLPTEELAELHAIIQAISYERGQKDGQPTG